MRTILLAPLLATSLAAALAGCAARGVPHADAPSTHPEAATPVVLSSPRPGLYSAAQPAAGDWPAIAARGVTTVIDLRMPGELQGRDEAAEVRAAGMAYRRIPVDGLAGINADNAQALAQALAGTQGPVLVHCSSGNRAGGLLAIAQAQAGMPVEQALDFGRAARMKGSEAKVREILGFPAGK